MPALILLVVLAVGAAVVTACEERLDRDDLNLTRKVPRVDRERGARLLREAHALQALYTFLGGAVVAFPILAKSQSQGAALIAGLLMQGVIGLFFFLRHRRPAGRDERR